MGIAKDISGEIFGRLEVISRSANKGKAAAWECLCSCGNSIVVAGADLRRGHTESCGCLLIERSRLATSLDLMGKRFGRLLVISVSPIRSRNSIQWECICDCGNKKTAIGTLLKIGRLVSCGCANFDKPGLRAPKERAITCVNSSKRRALKKEVGGSFTAQQIDELLKKQRYRCAGPCCGKLLSDIFHRDHRIALSKGGSNSIENIELLCPTCNLRKYTKDPISWAQQHGLLL